MLFTKRTDLAIESKEMAEKSAGEQTRLSGVMAEETTQNGCNVLTIDILNKDGEAALGKPAGTYITINIPLDTVLDKARFSDCVCAAAVQLRRLIEPHTGAPILICGLGNSDITPDAVGHIAVKNIMITTHLVEKLPGSFGHMQKVSAITPGVLGITGVESREIIKGVCERINPGLVIVVDALASQSLSRLLTTIQISNTGITPGSGVGNSRAALDRKSLGVEVIAVGVPTVVDAATVTANILERAGVDEASQPDYSEFGGQLIVTPKDIDSKVRHVSKIIGFAINKAVHDDISIIDMEDFLG